MVQGPEQCGYSAVQLIQLHDFDWLINVTYEDEYVYPKFQRSFNKQMSTFPQLQFSAPPPDQGLSMSDLYSTAKIIQKTNTFQHKQVSILFSYRPHRQAWLL